MLIFFLRSQFLVRNFSNATNLLYTLQSLLFRLFANVFARFLSPSRFLRGLPACVSLSLGISVFASSTHTSSFDKLLISFSRSAVLSLLPADYRASKPLSYVIDSQLSSCRATGYHNRSPPAIRRPLHSRSCIRSQLPTESGGVRRKSKRRFEKNAFAWRARPSRLR